MRSCLSSDLCEQRAVSRAWKDAEGGRPAPGTADGRTTDGADSPSAARASPSTAPPDGDDGLWSAKENEKQRAWWLAVRISAAQVGPSYGASAARDRATLHPVHRPALPCASHAAMCRGFLEEHSRFRNQMLPRRDGAWAIGSGEALLYLPVLDLVLHWRLAARHRTAICGDLG